MHGPRVELLPKPNVAKGHGQKGLEPSGPLVGTILRFPEMPEPVVPPPEGKGRDRQKPDEENEKAKDDGQKDFQNVNFLTCPETS